MRENIGPTWPSYLPLIGTLGVFILISNLMGLVPGLGGPTAFIETNLCWAIMAFAVSEFCAIRAQGWSYIEHLAGPVWPLWPLLFAIEVIAHASRLLSLTVRLTGNMFADHAVIAIFLTMVPIGVPVIFMALGMVVSVLQAFIFALLTMVYIGLALEEEH